MEHKNIGRELNILLVHGSPRKVDEYILEYMEEARLSKIMQEAKADILCFGHSHKHYHRFIDTGSNGKKYYRHAINIGSVGKPKDNNPNGCYVLLSINSETSTINRNSIGVQFKRFEYDVEKAAKGIEESPLPRELAEMLRHGY